MILLTGATGYVGRELVAQLAAAGAPVRALVRDPEAAPDLAGNPGVEVVAGDFAEPGTLDAALSGVERAFLLSPPGPRMVELQGNFVEAARRSGVRRVVKASSPTADPDSLTTEGRWHGRVEKTLEESGMAWTHLRPSFFMQNLERYLAPTIRSEDAFYLPVEGTRAALVDTRDIAAVAAAALLEDGHGGESYLVTGPEALSFGEVAEKLSAALGRRIAHVYVPPEEYEKEMLEAGQPDWLVAINVELPVGLAVGGSEVTDVVRRVAKKEPISLEEHLREFAEAFDAG